MPGPGSFAPGRREGVLPSGGVPAARKCGDVSILQDFVTKKVRKNYGGKRGTVPQVGGNGTGMRLRTAPEASLRETAPALCRMNIRGDYASF